MSRNWIPEIMYEDSPDAEVEGLTSNIPFIPVPENESMPSILFIFESRETGEFEPGLEGEELPVINFELHQYADMAILKEKLDADAFDVVRDALSLEPLNVAAEKGTKITDRVRKNLVS
jgi:hypothetical protein|tara:strand:+ start:294 stop:650 length:357 start_codon:yes stop_codon:yes gene_type:complete